MTLPLPIACDGSHPGGAGLRILVDIGHPAHVHFFRNPIRLWTARGHRVLVTSRRKEMALDLLDELGLAHRPLSVQRGRGYAALARELLIRNGRLYRLVRRWRPDVMTAIGGIFVAQVGCVTGVPAVVFYDTENALLQNAVTYPLASLVAVPRCYEGWLPARRHVRYAGFHELAYLDPRYFTPSRKIALANGLATEGDTFFVRVVSWRASHDIGEQGWYAGLLERVAARLQRHGRVLISAEGELPAALAPLAYRGRAADVHHVLAFCRAFVGESATMASECAQLGVPAIYAAQTPRGYTNELERRYGLVTNLLRFDARAIDEALDALLAVPRTEWTNRRRALLQDCIDVPRFVARIVLDRAGAGCSCRAGSPLRPAEFHESAGT